MSSDLSDPKVRHTPAHTRLLVVGASGVCVGVLAAWLGHPGLALLAAWDTAAALLLAWVWSDISRLDQEQTCRLASLEDAGRTLSDGVLLTASVASLAAVGQLLFHQASGGISEAARAAVGVVSVVLSWGVVHTVYTLRYARLYYDEPVGGVDFNEEEPPSYLDFAYLAFTIGMTFQVSDTNVRTKDFRAAALGHALWSYLFGTAIIAVTVNLLAGLSK
jgi:uncharacterized membrane protein